jgi:hypothetical protein
MPYEEAIELVRQFIEEKPACSQALAKLKKGVEIRVLLDGKDELAIFHDGEKGRMEVRAASSPDVEFTVNTAAVQRLHGLSGDNMAKLGIEVVREIASGNASVRVCGSIFGVLRNGYLSIIKEAGPDFTKFLASYGLSSINKVIGVIKRLKAS